MVNAPNKNVNSEHATVLNINIHSTEGSKETTENAERKRLDIKAVAC
jgi:hypothetical protein